MKLAKALTIAGSDSGGGAGIQADLKTFQELGVYGMSAITAITAQNTLGVQGVYPLTPAAVAQQIESVASDLAPDAAKTGMLFSSEIMKETAVQIKRYHIQKLVVDPVMIAKGGAVLLEEEAIRTLKEYLLPLALVVTPNIPEAEKITGLSISSFNERKEAAKILHEHGASYVVIKGGHADVQDDIVVDLLYDGYMFTELVGKRVDTAHTHGTGCTFAAVMTAELAKGAPVTEAAQTARHYIQAALEHPLGLGQGHGPTNHWAYGRRQGKVRI
ncbi:bifunctional hydroxymethylpyrimidine kinase/phosphomethylpyrimidine kinase [Paenibacillus sp. Marseille-Q4541]|uniref:bifunctional hydroxymethylpyrimidine kinase/phosphomethylpyrimidine kinase n=1 Tax=Paenibacillus sp. Marseille-Q4541 TaxID=2831522 RepID=UPI001BAB86F2|nr:bifunctional hydroxymethylpyrimidine kinase/phosphomethylpyrimidine kinase [Paenibacillus sp. Marseille-Q4541]